METPEAGIEVEVLPDDEFSVLRSATEAFVKEYMPLFKDASHDYTHIERVRKVALQIAAAEEHSTTTAEPINIQLVELASLLHDVGDKKFLSENETTVDCLRASMSSLRLPSAMQVALIWIIHRVSFRAEIEEEAAAAAAVAAEESDAIAETALSSWRRVLHCVQDADRLDAIGAIGIARCFSFNGARNLPIYEEKVTPIICAGVYPKGSNARNHFFGKSLSCHEHAI
jgi:uncharacterized protein